MTITLLWLQLLGAAVFILIASNFLAKSTDVIAFKTGLGRSFVGVVLLATVTSLPELGTGVSSIAIVDAPDLAAGDAFGSNLFNLLIIGLMDVSSRQGPILNRVSTTSLIVASLGIVMISLAAIAILIHSATSALSGWYISPISIIMILVFLGAMYIIYIFEQTQDAVENENQEYVSARLSKAILSYLASAIVIIGAAVWLARTGDALSHAMGWEASFIGTQFLALSTSLPELAASFAAIRINAPELAITNVLGSNLFNMGFVLFLDDVALIEGPLWSAISTIHSLTAIIAILMTATVIIAFAIRMRSSSSRFWTIEAAFLIGLYLVASLLVFKLG